jgi:hypothetical protein
VDPALSSALNPGSRRDLTKSWLHRSVLCLAVLLCLVRFFYLRADFPNHSPWLVDSAKFTDEGWWANAAVRHFLLGHWRIPGDYNPAVVTPVWPVLLGVVFHFTGVSLVATRALNVAFSVATVGFVYLLMQRYQAGRLTAAVAALLLAASPFAFVFSRLASLDTLMVFEWVLCLWIASLVDFSRLMPLVALCLMVPLLLLTKTTALVLLPALCWLVWKRNARALLLILGVTGAAMALFLFAVLHSRYAVDYRYFFTINGMEEIDWKQTGCFLEQLFENGLWVDRVLYPASLLALVLALTVLRNLWKNPLFTASWIAIGAQCVFILRRQDDYAPRYFLVMLVPMIAISVLMTAELFSRWRPLGWLASAALAVAVLLNTSQIAGFLRHRQYQFYSAAISIRGLIDRDGATPRLVLGTSAEQLALMNGIPAINDSYTSEELGEKCKRLRPGWYVGWNDLDQDILDSLSDWRLEQVANYLVFDRTERNQLKLYRMVPLGEARQ